MPKTSKKRRPRSESSDSLNDNSVKLNEASQKPNNRPRSEDTSTETERVAVDRSESTDLEDESSSEALNDPSDQLNEPTEKLNDPTVSERTVPLVERTNKNRGNDPAFQADSIPLVVRSVETPGRSMKTGVRSEDETPSLSERDSVAMRMLQFKTLVRNLRRHNLSYGTIEILTGGRGVGLAKSTMHLWAGDISPEEVVTSQDSPNAVPEKRPDNAIPLTIHGGPNGEGLEGQHLPRISSEVVVSRRPTIIDDDENSTTSETRQEHEFNGSIDRYEPRGHPATPLVDEATVRRLIMMFGEDCMKQGYDDFVPYFREVVIPKTRVYEYWAAYIPGKSDQEKTRNLLRYLKAAKQYLQQGQAYMRFENESLVENDGFNEEES